MAAAAAAAAAAAVETQRLRLPTASRPDRKDNVRWHHGKLLIIGIFLLVAFYVALCRLENDYVADGATHSTLLAPVALPPVLTDAATAALLADATLPAMRTGRHAERVPPPESRKTSLGCQDARDDA